jgi:microcystin-dependent protein
MGDPFIAEIRIFSFNFPPRGWALCDGQLLAINQNQALFSLVGTTYGGNGVTTFGLPDLRGRAPLHTGQGPGLSNRVLGERAGEEGHTLLTGEIPAHTHPASASTAAGDVPAPANNLLAAASSAIYADGSTGLTSLNPGTIAPAGSSQPHENMEPSLTLSFCIALVGIFPPRE